MGSRMGKSASRMKTILSICQVKTEWRQKPAALTQAFSSLRATTNS